MPRENAVKDDNRNVGLIAIERGGNYPTNLEVIEQDGKKFLPVALYSWNFDDLEWQAGMNLQYDGDLTVNLGDVERGVTGIYWQSTKWDWDGVRSLPLYRGRHININPSDADVNHYVTKWTWHSTLALPLFVQEAVGSWTGRAALF